MKVANVKTESCFLTQNFHEKKGSLSKRFTNTEESSLMTDESKLKNILHFLCLQTLMKRIETLIRISMQITQNVFR